MTRRQRFQRLAIIVAALGVTALTALYIRHRPVLLRDPALTVTYRVAGTSHHDGVVFKSMFSSLVRFIYLPQAPLKFQWFGYSSREKVIGQWPSVRTGLFGWSTTQPPRVGIALNDLKLEDPDPWVVDFSGDTLSFSARTLAVTVTPR